MTSHGAKGRGITLRDIVAATSAEAQSDMGEFFERHVTGTTDVPLPALLDPFGVRVTEYRPWTKPDGSELPEPKAAQARTYSGIEWSGNVVRNVRPDSPALRAGVMLEDEVIAIDGRQVDDASDAQRALASAGPGATTKLHLFRDGQLRQLDLQLTESPFFAYQFDLMDDATMSDEQKTLRKAWLGL
jgi:predicted metalloprotease with PDZ domain